MSIQREGRVLRLNIRTQQSTLSDFSDNSVMDVNSPEKSFLFGINISRSELRALALSQHVCLPFCVGISDVSVELSRFIYSLTSKCN